MSKTQVINSFTLKLYHKLATNKHENFVMSPLSISTALTICYFGARNETAKQIKEALDLSNLTDEEILKINEEYDKKIKGEIDREFVNPNKSTIKLANKLYTKDGIEINKDFLDLASRNFQSEVESVDYSRPNEAAEKVNGWISQQTHDRIKRVVTEDSFNDSNRMLLVNTVYFFAEWFDRFYEEETVKKDFHDIDGKISQVDMMHMSKHRTDYLHHPGGIPATVCSLIFRDFKTGMIFVLPDKKHSLDEIESKLTPEILDSIISKGKSREVNIQLPKFKLEYKSELSTHLKEMGVKLAFDNNAADFSAISSDPRGFFLSDIVHQAFIDVNEKGVEAAASTEFGWAGCSDRYFKPADFFCDRPFLFILTCNYMPLFIGKFVKPN